MARRKGAFLDSDENWNTYLITQLGHGFEKFFEFVGSAQAKAILIGNGISIATKAF